MTDLPLALEVLAVSALVIVVCGGLFIGLPALLRRRTEEEDAPYVCPGCYAVGPEPCAPGCIDAEIEAERVESILRGYDRDDDDDEEGGDD